MSFGKNIGYYRRKLKITQEELAERLYVSRQTISRWETDSVFPDVETIIKLCELFDCDMDTLVRGDAESKNSESEHKADEKASDASPEESEIDEERKQHIKSSTDRWWLGERINIAICSTIMIIAILVFFLYGIFGGLWHPAWVAFVVGALLCGISSVIISAIFHM